MKMGCKIKGVEFVFPKKSYSNDEIRIEHPDYDIGKFQSKVGISTRYRTDKNETGLDLAEIACNALLDRYPDSKIDYILYCTSSPDYVLPTTACILQDRLKWSKNIGALYFNLGCSGYIYGLQLARNLILSGDCKNILLVTAETYTKYIHELDVVNKAIFGDAASASLIVKDDDDGILKPVTKTDGSGFEKLIIKNGGARFSFSNKSKLKSYGNNFYTDNNLYMCGPDIFNFTIENIPNLCNEVLEINNLQINDIDYVIFHQANKFMLNFLRKKINFPENKFHIDMEDGGNTVSSTIPIAIKRAIDSRKINIGDRLLLVGFGVGLSYAGIVVEL